jgi:ribonuclease P protein component
VRTVAKGCIRILYRIASVEEVGADVPLQIGFAPGRTSGAVSRNRIRRIMREVYRVSQHDLIDLSSYVPGVVSAMVLFRGKQETAAECIPKDLPEALRRLGEQLRIESSQEGETAE